jgi:hypothetical protein
MTVLEKALIQLASTLTGSTIPYMIIGGMANAVWGEPRATLDIDATVWVEDGEIENSVSLLSKSFRVLVSDSVNFIYRTRVLPLESDDGVRIDLIFGSLPYERDAINRAVDVTIADCAVRFCTPEDLILHKIVSERERDLADAKGVTIRRINSLDLGYLEPRIRELSDALDRPDIWRYWEDWKQEAKSE